jgi:hypothetical protein
VDIKSKINKIGIKHNSKLLLFSGNMGASKPEGIRWWCRFPKHITSGGDHYVSTSDQSICYVPLEDDIEVHGFGFYRHSYDTITAIQLRTTIRVTNE